MLVGQLQEMLHTHNELIQQIKTAKDLILQRGHEDVNVIIRSDCVPAGEHRGRYNAPTANEVAAVIVGKSSNRRDIVLETRDDQLVRIDQFHCFYDALQYPLIFWNGQAGYSFNIPLVDPITGRHLHKTVTSMKYYAYHFMVRYDNFNQIHRSSTLFSQLQVDAFSKIDAERFSYLASHQQTLRSEDYIHLQDAVLADANVNASNRIYRMHFSTDK